VGFSYNFSNCAREEETLKKNRGPNKRGGGGKKTEAE
jgi:hypothetical protein